MITDFPEIVEVDINPLLATSERVITLDARVALDKNQEKSDHEHLCILPYPKEYVEEMKVKSGETVQLRPIKAEDEPLLKELFSSFSGKILELRFFQAIKDITHDMLARYCHIDYDREMSIVAEFDGKIIGMSRLIIDHGENNAEFSVVVADAWQNKGLGNKLVDKIVDIAKRKDLDHVFATINQDNMAMKHVADHLGFKVEPLKDDPKTERIILGLDKSP
jgi:acetyltransferase